MWCRPPTTWHSQPGRTSRPTRRELTGGGPSLNPPSTTACGSTARPDRKQPTGRGLEGIIGSLRLPGAIAGHVFRDEDHVAAVGRLDRLHPLVGIEAVGIDLIAGRGLVVPFATLVNIRRPVEEKPDAGFVPRDLLWRRHGKICDGFRRAGSEGETTNAGGEKDDSPS
jgi:hypothetical protein